jgi:hypothetical protein
MIGGRRRSFASVDISEIAVCASVPGFSTPVPREAAVASVRFTGEGIAIEHLNALAPVIQI